MLLIKVNSFNAPYVMLFKFGQSVILINKKLTYMFQSIVSSTNRGLYLIIKIVGSNFIISNLLADDYPYPLFPRGSLVC